VNTKRPPTDEGWKEAALYRDKYEELKGIGRARVDVGTVPTFAQLSLRYFESQKFSKLAATSQQDRRYHLSTDGPVMGALAESGSTRSRRIRSWTGGSAKRGSGIGASRPASAT
jgi:hypothetical protein